MPLYLVLRDHPEVVMSDSTLGPYGDLFTSNSEEEHEEKLTAWSANSQAERDFVLGTKLNHLSKQMAIVQSALNLLGEALLSVEPEAPAEAPAEAEAQAEASPRPLRLPRPSAEPPAELSATPASPLPVV